MEHCPECMTAVQKQKTCPQCGFDLSNTFQKVNDAMPMGTVINNQYELGSAMNRSRQSIVYAAWDQKNQRPALIEEFFPTISSQREQDRVVPKQAYAENFRRAVSYIEKLPQPGNRPLPCYDSFRVGGTVVRVYGPVKMNLSLAAQAEELLDAPILFFDQSNRPLMTINALPIPPLPPVREPRAVVSAKAGKNKHMILLAIIAVLAALVVGAIAYFGFIRKKPDIETTPEPTATTTSTVEPTEEPTAEPTEEPTEEATEEPMAVPTEEPTEEPTEDPTTEPTEEPTAEPTEEPTAEPTEEPTAEPTEEPTATPTEEPTATPTEEPTATPTEEPTATPTPEPTPKPFAVAGEKDSNNVRKLQEKLNALGYYSGTGDVYDGNFDKYTVGAYVEMCSAYGIVPEMDEDNNIILSEERFAAVNRYVPLTPTPSPEPTATATPAPTDTPALTEETTPEPIVTPEPYAKFGDKDDEPEGGKVRKLQELMSELGYYHAKPNGIFGKATLDAFHALCEGEDIEVDEGAGYVTEEVFAQIEKIAQKRRNSEGSESLRDSSGEKGSGLTNKVLENRSDEEGKDESDDQKEQNPKGSSDEEEDSPGEKDGLTGVLEQQATDTSEPIVATQTDIDVVLSKEMNLSDAQLVEVDNWLMIVTGKGTYGPVEYKNEGKTDYARSSINEKTEIWRKDRGLTEEPFTAEMLDLLWKDYARITGWKTVKDANIRLDQTESGKELEKTGNLLNHTVFRQPAVDKKFIEQLKNVTINAVAENITVWCLEDKEKHTVRSDFLEDIVSPSAEVMGSLLEGKQIPDYPDEYAQRPDWLTKLLETGSAN